MKKTSRAFAWTLCVVVVGLFAMACPKKPKPVTQPAAVVDNTPPPVVAAPPAPVETKVKNDDFVQEPTVKPETLPANIDELNRYAQSHGYIQDAFFDYNEAALSSDAQSALTNSANWLKGDGKAYSLLIEGHCDERGTEQYNLALGDKRANTAKEYLATLGVDTSRVRTVSYGEERPFDPGHDDSAWAKNRRAHLVLVGK
ncbi:MAG TPA: OmpA family protein [Thermoanaerobaculia bacterium]